MTSTADRELPEVDVTPLERASGQLDKAVAAWQQNPSDEFIRDAVIQRFEFTYELSIKMLRRYLKSIAASDTEVDELTFRDLIRRAGDLHLLHGDLQDWLRFRQARTDTVHTYNETRAAEVAAASTHFASEAQTLLGALKARTRP